MKYLKKYSTEAERQAATAIEPSASIVVEDEGVYYDRAWDTPTEPVYENKSPYWTHDWKFIRPAEWPDLDVLDVGNDNGVIALTFDCRDRKANPDCQDRCYFSFDGNAGSYYTVERGNITNGQFIVNATYNVPVKDGSTRKPFSELLPTNEGDYVVYRLTPSNRTMWTTVYFTGYWGISDATTRTEADGYYGVTNKIVECYYNNTSYYRGVSSLILKHIVFFKKNTALTVGSTFAETDVEYIDLEGQNITAIGGSCFTNSSLRYFDFDVFSNSSSLTYNLYSSFNGCGSLEYCNVSNIDVSPSTNITSTFKNCYSLRELDTSKWSTPNLTNTTFLFQGCHLLEKIDLRSWSFGKVTTLQSMFNECLHIREILFGNPDFSKVTNASSMFTNCRTLTNCTLSGKIINFSVCTTFANMFQNCHNLTEMNMSGWDMSKITATSGTSTMFDYCYEMHKVVFPSTLSIMHADILRNCYNIEIIIVNATTPPTWAVTTTRLGEFNPNYKIYVPDASVETYKTATGWLNAADHIYGISTYTGD